MELYYYFRKGKFLIFLMFFGCKFEHQNLLDANFAGTWKNDIRKEKKSCSRYIGSNVNALDRVKVINLLDSIYSNKNIKIQSIEISNWRPNDSSSHNPSTEIETFFDITINKKSFYRITIKHPSNKIQIKDYSKSNIYFSSEKDVMKNDVVREFAYVHYALGDKVFRLKDLYIFCREREF